MATNSGSIDEKLHQMIREAAQSLANDYDWSYWRDHIERQAFPEEFWDDLAEGGWFGTIIPEEYGGEGLGLTELSILAEELQRQGTKTGILLLLTPIFGSISINRHGTEEQKEEYLPRMARGEEIWSLGLTEAGAGTNTLHIDTMAERDGDEFIIDGQKMWISGADVADAMLLVARTSSFDPENPTDGVTMFIVPEPADRDDIGLTPIELVPGYPETQFEVNLDGVKVHESQVLGEVGKGLHPLFDTLNPERIAGAASTLGTGLRAIDLAVEYAKDRVVWSEPIGAHQGIQHPLADAYSKLKVVKNMIYKSARQFDAGEDCAENANIAKLRTTEAAFEAANVAVQTHGGNGFTKDYEVFNLLQEARVPMTAPIANEMVKNHIAENALGLPKSY